MANDKNTVEERPAVAHQTDPYKHIEKLPVFGKRTAGLILSVVLQLVSVVLLVFAFLVTLTNIFPILDASVTDFFFKALPSLTPFFVAALFSVVAIAIAVVGMVCAAYARKSDDKSIAKSAKIAWIFSVMLLAVGLVIDLVALIGNSI